MKRFIDNAYDNEGSEYTIFFTEGTYELWYCYNTPDEELIRRGSYGRVSREMIQKIDEVNASLIG